MGELGAGLALVLVGGCIFDECGSGFYGAEEGFVGALAALGADGGDLFAEDVGGGVLDVPGGFGGGDAELFAEGADFGEGAGEEAGRPGFRGCGR